jgi:hypothetical protein
MLAAWACWMLYDASVALGVTLVLLAKWGFPDRNGSISGASDRWRWQPRVKASLRVIAVPGEMGKEQPGLAYFRLQVVRDAPHLQQLPKLLRGKLTGWEPLLCGRACSRHPTGPGSTSPRRQRPRFCSSDRLQRGGAGGDPSIPIQTSQTCSHHPSPVSGGSEGSAIRPNALKKGLGHPLGGTAGTFLTPLDPRLDTFSLDTAATGTPPQGFDAHSPCNSAGLKPKTTTASHATTSAALSRVLRTSRPRTSSISSSVIAAHGGDRFGPRPTRSLQSRRSRSWGICRARLFGCHRRRAAVSKKESSDQDRSPAVFNSCRRKDSSVRRQAGQGGGVRRRPSSGPGRASGSGQRQAPAIT